MNKFLSAALFVNVFVSPSHVVASDADASAAYVSSSDVIDRGLGTTSFLSDNSAKSATTRMLRSLKGTNNFIPLHEKRQTSQKMTNFQSNNRQEPHVERNMPTQTFLTKSELQTAVNEYCSNPCEWVNHPKYATYGPIPNWDVSLITDMSWMFNEKSKCNPDITSWDVSAVTNFYGMFKDANAFNRDIGSWDVSNGVDFNYMFYEAKAFNQDIGSWDVSNGVKFDYMFYNASVFRQNLCSWDKSPTSTRYDFCTGSYCGTCKFLTKSDLQTAVNEYCFNPRNWVNRPKYAEYGPITDWDVSLITDMSWMFNGKSKCNPDIASWDVSSVTTFDFMFYSASVFNQDIGSWDVSKGVNFSAMFYEAKAFNQDIGSWDVSKGDDFVYMFYNASAFKQNLCSWDKSPTSNKYEFCTGSYCGDCSRYTLSGVI